MYLAKKEASAEKNLSQETKKMKEMWKRKNEIRIEGRGNVTSLRTET